MGSLFQDEGVRTSRAIRRYEYQRELISRTDRERTLNCSHHPICIYATIFGLGLSVLLNSGAAFANAITYIETATISGTLNGRSFSGDLLTLTGSGDTSNISILSPASPVPIYVEPVTLTFTVDGFSGTFANGVEVLANDGTEAAGFTYPSVKSILFTVNAALLAYDLTPIDPVTGPPSVPGPYGPWSTTAGAFEITQIAGDLTFSTIPGPNVTIPGPTLGAGLPGLLAASGGLLAWRRRKRKAEAAA